MVYDKAQKWKNKSLGVRFCTENLSLSEINVLILILQEKYKLKCSTQKKQNNFRVYISSKSHTILTKLIFRFIIPSMIHKFPTSLSQIL